MDHIRLSPRLQMVADFVRRVPALRILARITDIYRSGCCKAASFQSAIAADIHAGPLANARQSVAAYDLEERFRFVQADGLQFSGAQAADVIAIAGMGGETICTILAAAHGCGRESGLFCSRRAKSRNWQTGSGTTALRLRMQPCAAMPGNGILPCVYSGEWLHSHARWNSCCFGTVTRCCRST